MTRFYNFFLVFCLVVIVPIIVHANVHEDPKYMEEQLRMLNDSYWKERATTAEKANLEAYTSDPLAVVGNLSSTVIEMLIGEKNARRNLREGGKTGGPCQATNPIDRCWRCDRNWANNRKRLVDCVLGFGSKTTGGKDGPFYLVTDSSDNDLVNPKPGTLRHAVTRNGPLWIIFAKTMSIRLSQELIVASDKTIDGRGVNVKIANGAGITLQYVKNVIIHGIRIFDIMVGNGGMIRDSESHFGQRTKSDGDGISIFGSSNIWIDHVSMRNARD